MALFEGSVAFVMIGAVMKSMDPALEEASQVIGAGRLRTMLRVTLPLVAPGVLGAAIFVFAEMLGSFSAALVLGMPNRFYVVTTAIYQLVSQYPPRLPLAAAMGVSLFAVMFAMLFLYRRITAGGSYVTITGKAFRPRVDGCRAACAGSCSRSACSTCSVGLPADARRWSSPPSSSSPTAFPAPTTSRSSTYRTALLAERRPLGDGQQPAPRRSRPRRIGVVLMGLLAWII